jgi:hypothetical protein
MVDKLLGEKRMANEPFVRAQMTDTFWQAKDSSPTRCGVKHAESMTHSYVAQE